MREDMPAVAGVRQPARRRCAQDVVLRVSGLAKAFGATQALRDCSLELRRGEVHVLMGENGSGKSTLVKILSGVHRPDSGTIEMPAAASSRTSPRRAPLSPPGSPPSSRRSSSPASSRCWRTSGSGSDGLVRRRGDRGRATRAGRADDARPADRRAAHDRPRAGRLTLSDRQAICIARALLCEPRVLILDEATSALDVATRDNLFAVLRGLCAEGVGVLFISHRMDEVEEIADRITVMRSGETVATRERGEVSVARARGADDRRRARRRRDAAATPASERGQAATGRRCAPRGAPARRARPIDVEIRAGELVGVAGLEGHGQDQFLRVLAGPAPVAGSVDLRGARRRRALRSPADALAPRRRLRAARPPRRVDLRVALDPRQLPARRRVTEDRRGGLVRRALAEERFERYVDSCKIRAGIAPIRSPRSAAATSRRSSSPAGWRLNPRVLLLNDPTRGVDIGTKTDIYHVLTTRPREGVAVVMLSTEVIELVELMDRVLVFREGELFRELPARAAHAPAARRELLRAGGRVRRTAAPRRAPSARARPPGRLRGGRSTVAAVRREHCRAADVRRAGARSRRRSARSRRSRSPGWRARRPSSAAAVASTCRSRR